MKYFNNPSMKANSSLRTYYSDHPESIIDSKKENKAAKYGTTGQNHEILPTG